jgi:hypothetical protein
MNGAEHIEHLNRNVSHNNCPECRADCERRWVIFRPFKYDHVAWYLTYVKPRLAAIRDGNNGGNTPDADCWHRDFIKALHNRINSHIEVAGRKYCHSYLERLRMTRFPGSRADAAYLRMFAKKGASTL